MYKRKHPERFNAWWRPLTRQGDPSHRYDLVGEAFDAGYEAGKGAALLTLGRKLIEQYAMPHDADPPLGMEAHMAERLAQETGTARAEKCFADCGDTCQCERYPPAYCKTCTHTVDQCVCQTANRPAECTCNDYPGADEFCTAHQFQPCGAPLDADGVDKCERQKGHTGVCGLDPV